MEQILLSLPNAHKLNFVCFQTVFLTAELYKDISDDLNNRNKPELEINSIASFKIAID